MRKNRKMLVISGVIILISTLIMSLSIQNIAFGDPGSPMDLTATITTASDGVAPLPAIDSSTSNGEVGNLDLVTQNFDFTINPNDGRSHNLTHVIITATLTPAAGDAN